MTEPLDVWRANDQERAVLMVADEFLKNDRATGTPKRIRGLRSDAGLAELRTRVGTA